MKTKENNDIFLDLDRVINQLNQLGLLVDKDTSSVYQDESMECIEKCVVTLYKSMDKLNKIKSK